MATLSSSILTESDYFKFLAERPENARFELCRGELVPMAPVGYVHARRVSQLSFYLWKHLSSEKYDVLSGEAAIILQQHPLTIRGMDLAVLYKPTVPISGALRQLVLLAIEVVSPSDSPVELERKRTENEAFGIQEVWIVYEETKTVHVSQVNENRTHFIAANGQSFVSVVGIDVQVSELFL